MSDRDQRSPRPCGTGMDGEPQWTAVAWPTPVHTSKASRGLVLATVLTLVMVGALAQTMQIPQSTITRIATYQTAAYVYYSPSAGTNGCTQDGVVVITWSGAPDAKAMFGALLAAHARGQTVGFGVSGCYNTDGTNTAPKVYRVDLN